MPRQFLSQATLLLGFLFCLATPIPAQASVDSDPLIQSGRGRELLLRGEYEQGLEHLDRAYRLFPLNPGFKRNLAEGYAAYGHHLFKLKRYEQADENFSKAAELYPDDPAYAGLRGICNYFLKKYDVARYELERCRQQQPDSIDVLYYLGMVLYETDDRPQAVQLWEQGLKLSSGRKEFKEMLEKARREMAVEQGMDRGHSSRFDLTYDPGVNTAFALAVLDVLEGAASRVGAELGHFPQARVPVAIYKRDDYKTVTASPDWSGGVYDGTIRLPFGAFQEVTPLMRGVLFHEYAHVVVFDLARGNCPLWLNEGIAEMFGRAQYSPSATKPGQGAGRVVPADFRKLEGSFSAFSTTEASQAYQQSYSLVNYIVTTYGWHRITGMLAALGNGAGIDGAVSGTFKDYGLSFDGLVREWRENVERSVAGK